MDFKKERVNSHNNWPNISAFKAEAAFSKRLIDKAGKTPFEPIAVGQDTNADFQRCVGHFLDGLDALPRRPDYLFDHSFRVIDLAGSPLFPKKGIKGIVQGLGNSLLKSGQSDWEAISEMLGQAIPIRTCELLAKRILTATDPQNKDHTAITDRASCCLGAQRYVDFMNKFAGTPGAPPITVISSDAIRNAGSFLKLYLSGVQGTRTKPASHASLDLTKSANLPTHGKRIELLLSILLFTLRNERAHGDAISPFRTSKATLERYQSYYFITLTSYVFALGTMQLRNWKGVSSGAIRSGCAANIALQQAFF